MAVAELKYMIVITVVIIVITVVITVGNCILILGKLREGRN